MESLTFSQRKLSRDEILKGLGVSVLIHALVFTTALISPWAKPKQVAQIPYSTVNLVSMEDLGGGTAPAPKGNSGKKADNPKGEDSPKAPSSNRSSRAKSQPLVPIRRLQLKETAPKVAPEVKKMEISEAPKVVETSRSKPSVEKELDSLIPKAKPEPKPKPIVQTAKASRKENPKAESPKAESPKAETSKGKEPASTSKSERSGSPEGTSDADDNDTSAKNASGGVNAQGGGTDTGKTGGKGTGPATSTGKGTGEGNGKGTPAGSPDGAMVTLARRTYYNAIWSAVRRNWALPEFLKSQHLETVLIVVLRRDGKVLDLRIEKGSGNALYDESAKRAVRKAEPLPPFPDIYSAPQEEIALRFTPESLS